MNELQLSIKFLRGGRLPAMLNNLPQHRRVLVAALLIASSINVAANPLDHSGGQYQSQQQWPSSVSGSVYSSSWPQFVNKTARWSAYEAPTFNQVFIPKDENELAVGLNYMTANHIPFLTKSGGHGYSTTLEVVQHGVLVNMENFRQAKVNSDGTAVFGGPVTFNDMIVTVSDAGRELTLGSCPCVGGVGAMLGGGLGRLQGLHGLTSDAVMKVRMALYNGTIIEASPTTNPDLFWGMRGAGQNFGIVIEAQFKTWPWTNGGMNYQADIIFTPGNVTALIDTINSLHPLPPPLSLIVAVGIDPTTLESAILLNLVYLGPESEGKVWADHFASISSSIEETIIPSRDLLIKGAGGLTIGKCVKGQDQIMLGALTKTIDSKSFTDMYESFVDFVHTYPTANQSILLIETFAQQGIDAHPKDFSAFPHRGTFNNQVEINIAYINNDTIAREGRAWGNKWRDHFAAPQISGYNPIPTYQNYATGDEPIAQLYGFEQWRQDRLTKLKRQYDPRGSFNAYHAVPTTPQVWQQ